MARTLKATGLYKSQRFIGSTITINDESLPPATYPGTIVEVYWASDAQGLNRTTEGTFDDARYLIVKTKDIQDTVTLYLNSDQLSTDDLLEGSLNSAITIPLTVDGNGNGFGFYKILTYDEDEMSFRNSVWQDLTATRTHSTVYKNETGKTIMVSIWAENNARIVEVSVDSTTWVTVGILGYDNNAENVSIIVPPNHYYRINGSTTINLWSELR